VLQYVWFAIATGICYCNHFRIVLQLVGIIAMALLSCISIDFRFNYLVLLQLYWIWLLLLVTIAMLVLGWNNLQGCCNCYVAIATRIMNGCNNNFLLPCFFRVVIIFCGIAIVRYLLQLQSQNGRNIMLLLLWFFFVLLWTNVFDGSLGV